MACDFHLERSQKRPGYYSECIEVVLSYIRDTLGYSVVEFDQSLPRCAEHAVLARIDYDKKVISSHCYCSGCKLLSYLHEAGHARHYDLIGEAVSQQIIPVEERESMAEKYGREISDELGFELKVEWEAWD
jgi:hypothetical protein